MPRVSVIIPAYNAAKHIGQAVDSVLAQTYTDYEVIVVDDGSTDNTRDVLKPYEDRIRYIWQENQERSAARNQGIGLAQGEYVAFLDADDLWLPQNLERHVAALDAHAGAVLAYSPAQTIDGEGHPTEYDGATRTGEVGGRVELHYLGQELILGCRLLTCATVVRRRAIERTGPFDTQLTLGEDWEMWLRLARLGPFAYVPQVLSQYRVYNWEREVGKRATDHLVEQYTYVIEKTAAANPGDIAVLLRDHALAMVYVRSGVACYQLGDAIGGKRKLAQAVSLNPLIASRPQITGLLENRARRFLRDTRDEARVMEFLNTAVDNLPPGIEHPRHGARGVLSRVYMADTFQAYGDGDRRTIHKVLWRGLRHDPTWLLNPGVLSIAARTLLNLVASRVGKA